MEVACPVSGAARASRRPRQACSTTHTQLTRATGLQCSPQMLTSQEVLATARCVDAARAPTRRASWTPAFGMICRDQATTGPGADLRGLVVVRHHP